MKYPVTVLHTLIEAQQPERLPLSNPGFQCWNKQAMFGRRGTVHGKNPGENAQKKHSMDIFRGNVWIPWAGFKSLHAVVNELTCATLVNTQTHTNTAFDQQ